MTLQRAKLTMSADPDGDGVDETGIFHFVGNLEITPSLQRNFLLGGRGALANAIFGDQLQDGESQRQGYYLDLGSGIFTIEVAFRGWEGATDDQGNNLQWGDNSTQALSQTSATGQDPLSQMDVFLKYMTVGTIDSRDPATLEYGEYSSSGVYSALDVVVLDGPTMTRAAEDGSWFDGSITFAEAGDFGEFRDALLRPGH